MNGRREAAFALAWSMSCAPIAAPPPAERSATEAGLACHDACARTNACRVDLAGGDLVTVADCGQLCDDPEHRRSLGLETPERLRCLRERPCSELDTCWDRPGAAVSR